MSPQASERAKSPTQPASTLTILAQQHYASNGVGKTIATASTEVSTRQQETAEATNGSEKNLSSDSQALSISHPQHSGPPNSTEDQLPTLITGLDGKDHQSKLDRNPSRELVKHTLLQEELAQVREENLNLRVDLQWTREKHTILESEYRECKKRKKQIERAMKKAMRKLSTGLGLALGGSTEPGQGTKGVLPDVSIPPQEPINNPTVEKASDTPNLFQTAVTSDTAGGTPVQTNIFGQGLRNNSSLAAKKISSNASQANVTGNTGGDTPVRPNIFGQGLGSNTSFGSFGSRAVKRPFSSMFGDVPSQTPKWPESFGTSKTPAPLKSINQFKEFVPRGKARRIEDNAEGGEGQTPRSEDVTVADSKDPSKPTGSEGAGVAKETSASSGTDESSSPGPFSTSGFLS